MRQRRRPGLADAHLARTVQVHDGVDRFEYIGTRFTRILLDFINLFFVLRDAIKQ